MLSILLTLSTRTSILSPRSQMQGCRAASEGTLLDAPLSVLRDQIAGSASGALVATLCVAVAVLLSRSPVVDRPSHVGPNSSDCCCQRIRSDSSAEFLSELQQSAHLWE